MSRLATIAIVGRPNVGKSTLLNRILGETRTIVSPIPGTTRDAVDSLIKRNGKAYRFVDTAGIRKKRQTFLQAEKLSVFANWGRRCRPECGFNEHVDLFVKLFGR